MYNPCFECMNRYGKQYTEECDNKCDYANVMFQLFFHILNYKSENVGIKYIENEEAYTSGTSFLDGEEPCKNNYNKERRIYRGLFISNKGIEINADVNGAYQIMKKVFPNVKFINGI